MLYWEVDVASGAAFHSQPVAWPTVTRLYACVMYIYSHCMYVGTSVYIYSRSQVQVDYSSYLDIVCTQRLILEDSSV